MNTGVGDAVGLGWLSQIVERTGGGVRRGVAALEDLDTVLLLEKSL
jgi:hypothetical protein